MDTSMNHLLVCLLLKILTTVPQVEDNNSQQIRLFLNREIGRRDYKAHIWKLAVLHNKMMGDIWISGFVL